MTKTAYSNNTKFTLILYSLAFEGIAVFIDDYMAQVALILTI